MTLHNNKIKATVNKRFWFVLKLVATAPYLSLLILSIGKKHINGHNDIAIL